MNISQYIIVKKGGASYYSRYTSRLTKGSPSLNKGEVAVKVNLELPNALWDKPSLEAKITVPEEAVSKPVIEAGVVDNVEELIKDNMGLKVKLEIVSPNKVHSLEQARDFFSENNRASVWCHREDGSGILARDFESAEIFYKGNEE